MIKVMVRDRREGKTTALVKWLSEATDKGDRILIVVNYITKTRLFVDYPPLKELKAVFTFDEVKDGYLRGRRIEAIAIDDVDLLLQRLIGPHIIECVTMYGERV
jgi:hypothetical protein